MPQPKMIQFRVEGVEDFVNRFKDADRTLVTRMRDALNKIGDDLVMRARGFAAAEGFDPPGSSGRGTGALMRKLTTSVSSSRGRAWVILKETAVSNRNVLYPAIFEFGHSEKWGHHPFMVPAMEAEEESARQLMERVVDEVMDQL